VKIALAGASYFLVVFIGAFAIGVVRVLVIAPRIGEVGAVLLEAPIILTLSWFVCGETTRRLSIPACARDRMGMGLVAFALLMAAEAALAVLAFGQTLDVYFAALARPPGALDPFRVRLNHLTRIKRV
jgi:hypothetical protein